MGRETDIGLRGDVAKASAAVIFEEQIPSSHGGDEQVLVGIVIDICERGSHGDSTWRRHSRFRSHILKTAGAKVLPQLAGSGLVHKVDVRESVAIDIGDGQPVAVIVVNRLVGQAGVVHNPVHERDSACR
jgi:hypothetical protein